MIRQICSSAAKRFSAVFAPRMGRLLARQVIVVSEKQANHQIYQNFLARVERVAANNISPRQ